MTSTPIDTLLDRIRARDARIGVIGLGYVGLPLAVEFARAGFTVTGFDVDARKTAQINCGRSYILFAVSGMLFNHESPRRGLEFVTR